MIARMASRFSSLHRLRRRCRPAAAAAPPAAINDQIAKLAGSGSNSR
jgi:hypothetical protein